MLENGSFASTSRRTLLLGASSLLLTGCSLRFEDGSHVPGPTATTPSDIAPLQRVRAYLTSTMGKCSHEKTLTKPAAATFALHQQQLTRIDATLKGLGATPPSPTSMAAPVTATSTASAKPTGTARSTSGHVTATASSSSTSSPHPTTWTEAEFGWMSQASIFAQVSSHSRPLVLALAASSIASTMSTHLAPAWPSSGSVPAQSSLALRDALAPAIAASEWQVARTTGAARAPIAETINWLYAARSLASTSAPSPSATATASSAARASSEPVWSFASTHDAETMTHKALQNVMSSCVTAGQNASTASECLGVLFIWTNAAATLAKAGIHLTAFPGLTD